MVNWLDGTAEPFLDPSQRLWPRQVEFLLDEVEGVTAYVLSPVAPFERPRAGEAETNFSSGAPPQDMSTRQVPVRRAEKVDCDRLDVVAGADDQVEGADDSPPLLMAAPAHPLPARSASRTALVASACVGYVPRCLPWLSCAK